MRKRGTKIKRPDAILSGDWHLREDTPTCRTDDFQTALWNKVWFIKDLQEQYGCPILLSGDLFHHWKPSPYLISKAIKHLPDRIRTIFGNHDLPQHNLDLADKSGLWTLYQAGKVTLLGGVHWGMEPTRDKIPVVLDDHDILVWHTMTYMGKAPYPGCTDPPGHALLRKYKGYDLILTGHNHIPFVVEDEGRLLVNPGSLTRQSADQIDFQPRVYLWYADTNKIEAVYLPIDPEAVSREHITIAEQRDERIAAFISQLNTDWHTTVSFEENLEKFIANNEISTPVKNLIYKAIQ